MYRKGTDKQSRTAADTCEHTHHLPGLLGGLAEIHEVVNNNSRHNHTDAHSHLIEDICI